MTEHGIFERINGWLVAGIAGVLNLLLLTWNKQMKRHHAKLEVRVTDLERHKADTAELARVIEANEAQHKAMFRKMDTLDKKIDESRQEIKKDIRMVATLLRDTGGNK